jgi:hypothetical protein
MGKEFNLDFQHFKSHLTHLELQANVRILFFTIVQNMGLHYTFQSQFGLTLKYVNHVSLHNAIFIF